MDKKAKKICAACDGKLGMINLKISDGKRICVDCHHAYDKVATNKWKPETWTVEAVKAYIEKGQYEEVPDLINQEFRTKCNVCGNIFCYTQADLKRNSRLATSGVLSSLGGIASALSGNTIASSVQTGNAGNDIDRIIDYDKCQKCNSTDISTLDDEAWEVEKPNSPHHKQPPPTTVSSADEIMKFKQLLDSGIITQEEFDTKKKELLGM